MNALGSRHMFWQAPPSAFTIGNPLRTIPIRTGGRPVGMGGGLFLSQGVPNRLNGITIPAILGRIQIAPGVVDCLKSLQSPPPQQNQSGGRFARAPQPPPPPNFPVMSDTEKQILFEVAQNPTDEELEDLATIDDLFNLDYSKAYTTTADICFYASQKPGYFTVTTARFGAQNNTRDVLPGEIALVNCLVPPPPPETFGRFQRREEAQKKDTSFLGNRFYCTNTKSLGSNGNFASMFGIDTAKTWGEVKQAVKNGQIMLQVKASYPFPPPIDTAPNALWNRLTDLPKLANVGAQIDPEAFSAYLTLKTLELYNEVTDAIIAEAKAAAKRAKRKALIKVIALSVASIVLAFVLPAVIAAAVTAIKIAVEAYTDAKERRKAAKAMAEAAKLFAEDAPAFAAQVQKTADMLDSEAAQAEADAPLTPEQLEAIQEVKAEMPSTPVGTYVIGGVAATGLIAALVTLFK
jgi:hypothetical protein